MSYLLDASVVIDWLKGRQPGSEVLADLIRAGEVTGINAITAAEVFSGVPEHKADETHTLLSRFDYWRLEYAVASVAGRLRHDYARRGRPLSVPDTLMAAHAISRDATLVTGNMRDFPMPELRILRLDH